nr:hypothetical protein [Streptomyces sp. SID14478]
MLSALSKQADPVTLEPLPLDAVPFDSDTTTSSFEAPLTSEPPFADYAPLTSEPPMTDEAPLTSEPTPSGLAAG